MFIRQIVKQNKGYQQKFIYHALMESYRTEKGPRQRMLLSLGKLSLPREQWKFLANRIEEILTGQQSFTLVDVNVETLAQHYAELLKKRQTPPPVKEILEPSSTQQKSVPAKEDQHHYEEVDVDSLINRQSRTIGAEHVCLSMINRIGVPDILSGLGFNSQQIQWAQTTVVGRMVYPSSEYGTYQWTKRISAIGELVGLDVQRLSHNRFYQVSDWLLENKEQIEKKLSDRERTLFSLSEKIILYDLTNTHFESGIGKSKKKRYGHSKQKRRDCPLVTLGLVIDEDGFPKRSEVFEGNVKEGKTLMEMVNRLNQDKPTARQSGGEEVKKTVVIDAGIAEEENLEQLRNEGYDYICVARNIPLDISPQDEFVTVRYTKDNQVEASLVTKENEVVLFCRSVKKKLKEKSIQTLFQERFEQELERIRDSIHKKGGTKRYDKVLSRIGRAQERYKKVAYFYDIDVDNRDGNASHIRWVMKPNLNIDERFSGTYYLRTSRMDITEKEIWNLYVMLTDLEDTFRCMKSELGLRPNYHQKDHRIEGHLFITVLAYHIVNCIQWYLHRKGIYMRWGTIRDYLSTQVRVTTEFTTRKGKQIILRNTTEPEPFHTMVAKALSIESKPLRLNKISI